MTSSDPLCPLCGAATQRTPTAARDRWFALDGDFELHRCEACDLAVTWPQLEGEDLARHYPADYDQWHRTRSVFGLAMRVLARFRASLPPYGAFRRRGGGALLDVGCGRGDLAAEFARAGWSAHGLDVSPAAVTAAREVGVDARVGTIDAAPWPDRSFDLIIMNHSLEHMHHPLSVLTCARQLLAPGGSLIVAVPNWASWQRRLFGTYWVALDVPRHLVHFSAAGLHEAARRAGFARGRTRGFTTAIGLPMSLWFRLAGDDALRGRRRQAVLLASAFTFPLSWAIGRPLGGECVYLVAEA